MGTLDLLVVKIASAQPVCLIICGKEARLKRNLKGKNELRKIGNKACAILIVTEKRTSPAESRAFLCIMCTNKYLMYDHCFQSNGSDEQ